MPESLRASPLQLLRHEFVQIECQASEKQDAHRSLPLRFNRQWAPANENPRQWRLYLTIWFGGEKEGKESIYSGMLKVVGYFMVADPYPGEKMPDLIGVNGASLLYGACREMLANLTARGPHGLVSLPAVAFNPVEASKQESATLQRPKRRGKKLAK